MKFNKIGEINNLQLLLGIIVVFLGTAGAVLWGVGIAINNATFSWLGGALFALVGFTVALLSRWFK